MDWAARRAEWDTRVKMFGKRAVFNICHKTQEELDEITRIQRETILPLFKQQLRGENNVILDFGCGWGRWSKDLADISNCVIGVDPTVFFLQEAEDMNADLPVLYAEYKDGIIPVGDSCVDVIWACLVLSTVVEEDMFQATLAELNRVLRPGGLMFLIDNTSGPAHRPVVRSRWSISRTIEEYQKAFSGWVDLKRLGEYTDLGEVNTIMAGRKR